MAVEKAQVDPVEGNGTSTWKIRLYEQQGTCWVQVSSDAKWRPKQSKLTLYKGSPPSDPTKSYKDRWWAPPDNTKTWDTGQTWGSGWSAALIAKDGNNEGGGDYYYVAKTSVTSD